MRNTKNILLRVAEIDRPLNKAPVVYLDVINKSTNYLICQIQVYYNKNLCKDENALYIDIDRTAFLYSNYLFLLEEIIVGSFYWVMFNSSKIFGIFDPIAYVDIPEQSLQNSDYHEIAQKTVNLLGCYGEKISECLFIWKLNCAKYNVDYGEKFFD